MNSFFDVVWWHVSWEPVTAEGLKVNAQPFKLVKATSAYSAKKQTKRGLRMDVGPLTIRKATPEEIDAYTGSDRRRAF